MTPMNTDIRRVCFVVVSVISDENEARLLKDVRGMLSSFEVTE